LEKIRTRREEKMAKIDGAEKKGNRKRKKMCQIERKKVTSPRTYSES